jgi:hypothetical protein
LPIISSIIADVSPQRDARRWVRELHTDHLGVQYVRTWLAQLADDLNAAISAYAAQLLSDIRDAEIARNVAAVLADGRSAVTSTNYSTAAQNFAALRTAYQNATRTEAIFIGDFLGSLSDVQLQAAFGMTAGQVTTLRTNKLTPATNAATTIRATTGA